MARKWLRAKKASGLGQWLLRLVTFALVAGCATEDGEDLQPRPGAPNEPGMVSGSGSVAGRSSGGSLGGNDPSGDQGGGTAPGGNLGPGAGNGDPGTSIPSLPGEDSGVSGPVPWGNPGGGTRIPSLPGEDSGVSGPRPWTNTGNGGTAGGVAGGGVAGGNTGGVAGGTAGGTAGATTGTGVPAGNFEQDLVSALLQDNAALMAYANACVSSATSAEVASMCQYLVETRSAEMEWLDAWWQGRGGTTGGQ